MRNIEYVITKVIATDVFVESLTIDQFFSAKHECRFVIKGNNAMEWKFFDRVPTTNCKVTRFSKIKLMVAISATKMLSDIKSLCTSQNHNQLKAEESWRAVFRNNSKRIIIVSEEVVYQI